MAIPWLIGAAVVAVGAAVIASSDDDSSSRSSSNYDRENERRREEERNREREEAKAKKEAEISRARQAISGVAKKYGVPPSIASDQLGLYQDGDINAAQLRDKLYTHSDKAHQLEEQLEETENQLDMFEKMLVDLVEAEQTLLDLASLERR